MKKVGELLKAKRKEMNFSLKEVENATSIRSTYLSAIEEGDFSKLISHVYAQGFVRQYANFLGMDGDKLIQDNDECFRGSAKQEFAYGIGTLEMRGGPGSGMKGASSALWIAAFGVILIAGWYLASYLGII